MKHHDSIKKLGRTRRERKALLSTLSRALITKEKIRTTETKAKTLRPYIEKLVTKGKKTNLLRRRNIIAKVGEENARKLIDTLSPRYKDRAGGYTRITKLGQRRSDSARMAQIEFVE